MITEIMTALKLFYFKLTLVYHSLQDSVAERIKHEAYNILTNRKTISNPKLFAPKVPTS